jgi:hypothetical protein
MKIKIPTKGYGRSYGYKCIMWKHGKCNSDYAKREKCDGFIPPSNCPYRLTHNQPQAKEKKR